MPSSKAKPKRKETPWTSFLRMLWLQPLYAVPIALFFGTLYAPNPKGYLQMFWISLVFAYVIGLVLWVFDQFIEPRIVWPQRSGGSGWVWQRTLMYVVVSFLGAFLAGFLIRLTLVPNFFGGTREVLVFGMYTLMFTVLAGGIATAYTLYHKAIDRAKSEEELNLARRIQRSFLLSQFPSMPRVEVHAVNVSSKQVSGDFYDVVPAGDDAFLLAIADVAGKGVPAALLTSMLQASLRTQAHTTNSVPDILKNINGLVYRSTAVHQFATFFLARLDERALRLVYSNAGHNYPVVFRRGGEQIPLERGGTVVGILESVDFEEGHVSLEPGDRVVFYTDGINEAANADGELFGEDRICQLVGSLPAGLSARDTTERILEGVRRFLDGVDPADDMTLMVLRVLEPHEQGPGPVDSTAPSLDARANDSESPSAARSGAQASPSGHTIDRSP